VFLHLVFPVISFGRDGVFAKNGVGRLFLLIPAALAELSVRLGSVVILDASPHLNLAAHLIATKSSYAN